MKIRTSYFPLGSSYYPPFHSPDDWARDVTNMARAGLNMIRTAELLASWDYIEPRRGEPDWQWLDRIFELANQNGVQILLGTGSCCPPIWMLEQYPDLQRLSREGVPYPTNTVWGWACVNHPGLRNEVSRYINLLNDRYGRNPTLFGWQIDNEIGDHTAFNEGIRRGPRRYAYFCYCTHCARLFREWLQIKYQEIEALNYAWSWDPTHHRYYDWHQIQPPRSMPAEWGNGTAWLDFRSFIHRSHTSYIAFQQQIIKSRDAEHPTMTNLIACLEPYLGGTHGLDHWQLGGTADVIGYDMYPRDFFKRDPAYTSWFMDFAYSVAKHNHRTLWMPELESGPIGGFSAGPMHTTRPQDIKRYNLACLGHGAKMILYQGYRDWNCIPLHWGALADFHGEPTVRYYAAAEVNRMVKDNESFFLDAQPLPAQVAIFHSQDNVTVVEGQANERFLYRAIRGVYDALWNKGFTIDFIAPQFIGSDTADYKVIVLPFVMLMPQVDAERIKEFVRQGGSAIGFAKLAHLDEKGWAWNDRPGAGLIELFGARETKLEVSEEPTDALAIMVERNNPLFTSIEASTLKGYRHRQTFELADDVQVLARFTDGAPAVIRRQYGNGQAILAATHLDIAVVEHNDPATKQLFANLMSICGVQPHVVVRGEDPVHIEGRIDAHLLELGDQHAVLINNEGERPTAITVTVPAAIKATCAVELFSGASLPIHQINGAQFTCTLPAADGVAVMVS